MHPSEQSHITGLGVQWPILCHPPKLQAGRCQAQGPQNLLCWGHNCHLFPSLSVPQDQQSTHLEFLAPLFLCEIYIVPVPAALTPSQRQSPGAWSSSLWSSSLPSYSLLPRPSFLLLSLVPRKYLPFSNRGQLCPWILLLGVQSSWMMTGPGGSAHPA